MNKIFKHITKTILTLVVTIIIGLSLASCKTHQSVKVIIPSGTPTLGLADFINNKEDNVISEVVLGSDPLVAAFTSGEHDIIVAPVNLGAKFFNSIAEFDYELYRVIVGGNFYLVTTEDIKEVKDLAGSDITVFGANSTPDVILRSILKHNNIEANLNYVDDVASANSLLLSGKAKTIVSAEPSLTVIKTKGDYHVIDLQELWQDMAGLDYAVCQAGIFVKKSQTDSKAVKEVLAKMDSSLLLASSNPANLASSAVNIDEGLAKLGVDKLILAIPNCHFLTKELNKSEVEFYLNKLIELGLGKSIGGKLPSEAFYR